MALDGRLLGVDLGRRQPGHQRLPFRLDVSVDQQHAIGDFDAGRDRVGVIAAGLDAVEQAGVDRGHRVLVDRAARAAVGHRELDLAVAVDDALFHHHRGLGHQHAVRVVERVGQAVVGDEKAQPQRRVVVDAGDAAHRPVLLRAELLARLAGRGAVGVEDFAVPLRLRRGRRPGGFGRVE